MEIMIEVWGITISFELRWSGRARKDKGSLDKESLARIEAGKALLE